MNPSLDTGFSPCWNASYQISVDVDIFAAASGSLGAEGLRCPAFSPRGRLIYLRGWQASALEFIDDNSDRFCFYGTFQLERLNGSLQILMGWPGAGEGGHWQGCDYDPNEEIKWLTLWHWVRNEGSTSQGTELTSHVGFTNEVWSLFLGWKWKKENGLHIGMWKSHRPEGVNGTKGIFLPNWGDDSFLENSTGGYFKSWE